MPERHELTDFQKGEIVGLRGLLSETKIGHQLGIPQQTICSFLHRLDERDSISNLSRSGRPRKTSAADDRYIVRTAESKTRVPLAELRIDTCINVCEQTFRRRLREAGIRKWRALNRPLLMKEHAAKHHKWVKAHQHWIRKDWERVAWSDECAVQKDSDPRKKWVFRRQNDHEKYAPQNVQGKSKGGILSQMIWGCFVGDKLGPIAFINGTVNTQVYVDILENVFLPFIDALSADGITDIVFQQDNARPHTAKRTQSLLENWALAHGFSLMEWPPNSPDMNPIEHLWAHLKLKLHQ